MTITACPYCGDQLLEARVPRYCRDCATPHHEDCWNENGGCTVFGCTSAPGEEAKITVTPPALASSSLGSVSPPQSYGYVPVYADSGALSETGLHTPLPPNLNWIVVLILNALTRGLFELIWMFVQARYTKKLDRESKGMLLYAAGASALILGGALTTVSGDAAAVGGLLMLAGIILDLFGRFSLVNSLQCYFMAVGLNLRFSGPMTFFFGSIYIQYHFNRIHRWKRTGVLS